MTLSRRNPGPDDDDLAALGDYIDCTKAKCSKKFPINSKNTRIVIFSKAAEYIHVEYTCPWCTQCTLSIDDADLFWCLLNGIGMTVQRGPANTSLYGIFPRQDGRARTIVDATDRQINIYDIAFLSDPRQFVAK